LGAVVPPAHESRQVRQEARGRAVKLEKATTIESLIGKQWR
jgi:hypothetical protein